ncbi:MAG TPA: acyl-CoA dehydrogenase family protein [Pseudolysinimonas sp.]|jgi:acyl-CoA dehydrogenase
MTAKDGPFVPVPVSEEEASLLETIARANEAIPVEADAPFAALWSLLVEIGLHTLVLDPDEEFGGAVILAAIAGALGRSLNADPFIWGAVAAPSLLRAVKPGRAVDELAERLRAGAFATVAMHGPDADLEQLGSGVAITGSDAGHRATGRAHFVPFASDAGVMLVVGSHGEDIVLAEVVAPGSLTREEGEPFDLRTPLTTVEFRDAEVRLLGRLGADPAELLATALLCQAAAIAGSSEQVLLDSVGYANIREQFGVPIAEFQAIRHRLAEMLVEVQLMRSATRQAANERDAAAFLWAGYHCMATAPGVARSNIQIHGGIGYTWEHSAHRHYRYAFAAREAVFSMGSLERWLMSQLIRTGDAA